MKEKVITQSGAGKVRQFLTMALIASMCMMLFTFVPAFELRAYPICLTK